jgi:hypothetical protein
VVTLMRTKGGAATLAEVLHAEATAQE